MDKYDPETKIYKCNSCEKYYYLGEEELRSEISDVLDNNTINSSIKCNLVFFACNNNLNEPFLEFLLLFEKNDNEYNFDSFITTNNDFDKIIEKLTHSNGDFDSKKAFLHMIRKNICDKFKISKDEFLENFDYIGFNENESNNMSQVELYLFICVKQDFYKNFEKIEEDTDTNNEKNTSNIFSFSQKSEPEPNQKTETENVFSQYDIAIIDEMVFLKHLNNIAISSNVSNLFNNEKFMFLKTEKNKIVDLPIISYNANIISKNEKNAIEFTNNLKKEPQSFNTLFGKRFIFSIPTESNDKIFSKYVLFLSNPMCIFNNDDVILNGSNDDFSKYKEEDTLIVSDLNNNTYYLVNSIVHFIKKF